MAATLVYQTSKPSPRWSLQSLTSKLLNRGSKNELLVISSTPLYEQQKEILESLQLNLLPKGKAYFLFPSDYYEEFKVELLNGNSIPTLAIIPGNTAFSIKNQDISSIREQFEVVKLPIPVKVFYEFVMVNALKPTSGQIMPIESCNLKCIQCPFHSQDNSFDFNKNRIREPVKTQLSLDHVEKFLNDFSHGALLRIVGYGEPALYPHLIDLVKIIRKWNLQAQIATNGLLMTKELLLKLAEAGLDQIDFSIDANNKEDYAKIRINGDFDVLLNNLRATRELKTSGKTDWRIGINYSFINPSDNIEENEKKALKIFSPYVDYISFRTAFTDCYTEGYLEALGITENPFPKECYDLLCGPVLDVDGTVYPCTPMGNVSWFEKLDWVESIDKYPLSTILKKYISFAMDKESPMSKICSKCTFSAHAYKRIGANADIYFKTVFINH